MKEYLKMSDVFQDSVNHDHDGNFITVGRSRVADFGFHAALCSYAAHAINSHDELVENMQYYKCEAEKLELRAIKEASGAQDLQSEVDRLRDVIESVISTSEALALKSPTSDWGDGFKECPLTTANALKNIIDIHHK